LIVHEGGSRIYASAEKDPQVFNLRVGTVRRRSALPWVMNLGTVSQRSM
jgi:hypothetical protein